MANKTFYLYFKSYIVYLSKKIIIKHLFRKSKKRTIPYTDDDDDGNGSQYDPFYDGVV